MTITRASAVIFAVLAFAGCGAGQSSIQSYWYSPLTSIAVGPSGPPSLLSVTPYCCPSTAIKVTASKIVGVNDFQWVILGLTVPSATVKGVQVCYQVKSLTQDSTYISQVRITSMTTPDKATVLLDVPAHLSSTSTQCFQTPANFKVDGTLTLELRMIFGNASDEIHIGEIELLTQ